MYSFSLDLSKFSNLEENIMNDYELIKSFYLDNFKKIEENEEKLEFKLNLKLEMEIDSNIRDIIENLNFSELLVNPTTTSLPYWIKFHLDFDSAVLTVNFYVFWMKKRVNEFEIFEKSIIQRCLDYEESILFTITEEFKNFITVPEKKVFLNWLLSMKEENVIKTDVNLENIIYGDSDLTSETNDDGELIKNDYTKMSLLKARSDKILEQSSNNLKKIENNKNSNNKIEEEDEYAKILNIGGVVGETISDRGSTFQAHAIKVNSMAEITKYLNYLKTNSKIIKATHNILAYRFKPKSTESAKKKKSEDQDSLTEGFDDDGETSAGTRLLGILQKMKVINIMVVVSRWFGGTNLGQDRFKHINDSAKNLIMLNKNMFEFE